MAPSLNIALPAKLPPATRKTADALKLVLAAQLSGATTRFTENDEVALVLNDLPQLTNASVAVRYILHEPVFDGSLDALLKSAAIEKAEAIDSLILKKKYTEALTAANAVVDGYKSAFSTSGTLGSVDVIYLASLYEAFGALDSAKHPTLAAWHAIVAQSPAFTLALEEIKRRQPSKDKKAAPKKKQSAGTEELVSLDLHPETQKIKENIFRKPVAQNEKILPKKGERNILITSALPYVNNVPHLGNVVGSTLSADVYARYCRARGYNTLYICGTDEYGTATETKALEEGVSCQALCDKYNAIHKDVYKWFDLSFDHFGRTTTPQQTEIAQDMFKRALENDYILEESMTQLYCEKCERFLADRYVEGICPKCKYHDARGDQCDSCGQLLNATDLVEPRCKLDNNTPIQKDSMHMFLDLTKLQPDIEAFTEKSFVEGKWSNNGINITKSWLKEGLRPRCITRDLKWGTPVPRKGYENKVFYVWFDAPIGYPSITANYTADWEKWWKNPENVKLYQFMGKDNVPFHSVIFPGSQLATKEDWTLVNHISTTEYLNYEGGKFSKSRNVGVFGTGAKETEVPPSVWRYYLLSSRPETGDSMFTWHEFITKNNSELLNNLGNFVNRAIKFVLAKYDGVIPKADVSGETEVKLVQDVNVLLNEYVAQLEDVKLRGGLATAMAISARGNQYLQDSNMSNALFDESRPRCNAVVAVAINLIYLLSALISPYMPATSESITGQLNAPLRLIPNEFTLDILAGHKLNGATYLFTKIDEKMEAVWKEKFGTSAK